MKKVMDYKEHPEVLEWARRKYAEADAIEKKNWEFVFPELSESEDERIRKRLVEYFNGRADNDYFLGFSKHELLAWLEKQKEQKAVEWSKEYESDMKDIIIAVEQVWIKKDADRMILLLKSLRPQSHWKPSEEQMDWLGTALRLSEDKPHIHEVIESLYNGLKKLM